MKLRYLGEGAVSIDGTGEISRGGTIDVPDAVAAALLEEQPQHFERADTRDAGGAHEGGD